MQSSRNDSELLKDRREKQQEALIFADLCVYI